MSTYNRHTVASEQGKADRQIRRVAAAFMITASLAASAACGPDSSDPPVDEALSQFNLVSAGPNQDEHAVGETSEPAVTEPLPDGTAESRLRRYSCTSTPYSLTTTPDKIVMLNPDSNKLWVGGLLQGDGFARGVGSLLELPIKQRAPLKIFIDLLGNDVTTTVDQPDAASVHQAVARLAQKAKADGVKVPSRATFSETTMDDTSHGLAKLGFSASFLGATAKGSLNITRDAQEKSYLVSFYQRQFTASMVTPDRASGLFSPDFTTADLKHHEESGRIGVDNPPVVVSSISYGRVLLYSVTSKESTDKVEAALEASAFGQSGEIKGEDSRVLKDMKVRAINIGGEEANFEALLKSGKIADYFTGNSDLTTAVPISYQLNNVVGKLPAASFNETVNYDLTECKPVPNTSKLVGVKVRMTPPSAYLEGPRNPAYVYGTVKVANRATSSWSSSRDNPAQIHVHDHVDLLWNHPDSSQPPWTVDLKFGEPITVNGNMNCKLFFPEIGADPSNQYRWTWHPGVDQYGDVKITGGSPRCRIDLLTKITKVEDLYSWEP